MEKFGRRPSCLRSLDTRENPRHLDEISNPERSDRKSVSFVCAPDCSVNRPRASDIVISSRNEYRPLEETMIRPDRVGIDVMVRAYVFESRSRVWSIWILVEVESDREHSVRAFELNGGYFLQKTPEALGFRILRDMPPLDQWVAYHIAICDNVDVNAPRPQYSTSRRSSLCLIRENEMNCGCLPSLSSQHDSFGLSDFCQIRQIAQKAMLLVHHKLQSRTLDQMFSLKWKPS